MRESPTKRIEVQMVQPQQQLMTRQTPVEVRCVECDIVATGTAEGWKAYVGGGFEDEPIEVIIYCPACAARECDG